MGKRETVIKQLNRGKKCSIIQINKSWCVLHALGSIERSFSTSFGGIGVGLVFCQSVLEHFEGKIRMISF